MKPACVCFHGFFNCAGEYSREAVQFLDVARLDPGAHQEAPAASLEREVLSLLNPPAVLG